MAKNHNTLERVFTKGLIINELNHTLIFSISRDEKISILFFADRNTQAAAATVTETREKRVKDKKKSSNRAWFARIGRRDRQG